MYVIMYVILCNIVSAVNNIGGNGAKRSGSRRGWKKDTPSPTPYPTEECILTGIWRDEDDPDNRGDFETAQMYDILGKEPPCPNGEEPQDAICREVGTKIMFEDYDFGKYKRLFCDDRGFVCRGGSRHNDCPDFEVQFCCPPY